VVVAAATLMVASVSSFRVVVAKKSSRVGWLVALLVFPSSSVVRCSKKKREGGKERILPVYP
jgi:uncharacterized membrane protein YadS